MLRDAWLDVVRLRMSQRLWEAIRPELEPYGNAGPVLSDWYRDHILSGCRRLLDRRRDVSSVIRALEELRRDRVHLTPEVVAGFTGASTRPEERVQNVRSLFAERFGAVGHIPDRAFLESIERLRRDHERVLQLGDQVVAHRSQQVTADAVSDGEITALLGDVLEVSSFWVGLLQDSMLVGDVDHLVGAEPMATALRLFRWPDYVEAKFAAVWGSDGRGGIGIASEEEAERLARLEYRFGTSE